MFLLLFSGVDGQEHLIILLSVSHLAAGALGFEIYPTASDFYVSSGDTNSGPHTHVANPLLYESSLQTFFFKDTTQVLFACINALT